MLAPYVRHPMRRVLGGPAWLAMLLGACVPAVSPDHAPREHEDEGPAAGAEADARAGSPSATAAEGAALVAAQGPFEVQLDGALQPSAAEAVASMAGRAEAPAHAERAAWSADGHTFVYCRDVPGLDCHECRFVAPDGTVESLESGPACGEAAVPRATLDARVAAASLAPPVAQWSAGRDVVLVVETREHEETNTGQPRPMLKVGARLRRGGPPAWLLHVDPCQGCGTDQACAAAAHLDALVLSPNGEWLAVLVHQQSSQGDDSLRVELLLGPQLHMGAFVQARHARP